LHASPKSALATNLSELSPTHLSLCFVVCPLFVLLVAHLDGLVRSLSDNNEDELKCNMNGIDRYGIEKAF